MKNDMSKILDLALTQAIDHYRDMEPDEVHEAIAADWPEQIAVLLVEFLFKTCCGSCGHIMDFIHVERDEDDTTFIMGYCDCEVHYHGGEQL